MTLPVFGRRKSLLGVDIDFGRHRVLERLDNLRPGRAPRWKVEDHRLGRSGSGM
jgi:hypothetical protein